jgi:hypothetical protein
MCDKSNEQPHCFNTVMENLPQNTLFGQCSINQTTLWIKIIIHKGCASGYLFI